LSERGEKSSFWIRTALVGGRRTVGKGKRGIENGASGRLHQEEGGGRLPIRGIFSTLPQEGLVLSKKEEKAGGGEEHTKTTVN